MATLEKIRSKSVFLIVIIAVALLAFILGDLITNGRNLMGNNTTVAKIGGEKIEYPEYQQKMQEVERMIGQNQEVDGQTIGHQALSMLMREKLLNSAVEKLDIKPSGELLHYYMLENPGALSPEYQRELVPQLQEVMMAAAQLAQQRGVPVSTPDDIYRIIFNPKSVNMTEQQVAPLQNAWVVLEAKYQNAIAQMIYLDLLGKGFKANELDKAAVKNQYAAHADVRVAKKPYGQLDEKQYPVSDDEIKKAYDEQKNKYAVDEPTKEVSFIAVRVSPSEKDMEEAAILSATVVAELKNTGALSKDTKNQGLKTTNHQEVLENVTNVTLKEFLSTAAPDSVKVLQSNAQGFSIAKFNGKSVTDSIKFQTVSVSKDLAPEIVAKLNGGFNVDSLGTVYSAEQVVVPGAFSVAMTDNGGNMQLDLALPQETKDSLSNIRGRYMVIDENEEVAVLGSLSRNSDQYEVYAYETVDYRINPSETTIADATSRFQKFLDANNTAQKFVANAAKEGYNAMDYEITAFSPAIPQGQNPFTGQIQYYPDTRSVVRWIVMDGKDGEVSKIYMNKDASSPMLYAVAVIDSYDDFKPWSQKGVKAELTDQIRRQKAGADMVKQFAGKGDIDTTAQAMGVTVTPGNVSLDSSYPITDKVVLGKVLGSKPSQNVTLLQGKDGVYAVVVDGATASDNMADEELVQRFMGIHQLNPMQLLIGNKKYENNIYKFVPAE